MSSEVTTQSSRSPAVLPAWASLLVVVAHPGGPSFGLSVILEVFARVRARVEVLCRTQGEAATLHGVLEGLASTQGTELTSAADGLGGLMGEQAA